MAFYRYKTGSNRQPEVVAHHRRLSKPTI